MSSREPDHALKVAVVYEDHLTREWARDLLYRATQLTGQECMSSTWWRIEELAHPAIFPDAVDAATRAEILVLSVNAKKELPLDFHVWIDAWLPRRQQQPGALVALIGQETGALSSGVQAFLQAVAQRGSLDFLPRAHEPLELPGAFPAESAPRRAGPTTQVHSTVLRNAPEACRSLGIND